MNVIHTALPSRSTESNNSYALCQFPICFLKRAFFPLAVENAKNGLIWLLAGITKRPTNLQLLSDIKAHQSQVEKLSLSRIFLVYFKNICSASWNVPPPITLKLYIFFPVSCCSRWLLQCDTTFQELRMHGELILLIREFWRGATK